MDRYKGIESILYGYKSLKSEIIDIDIQIRELESLEDTGVQGIDYSKDKLSPSFKFSSVTENEAIRVTDKVNILLARKTHAMSLVERLDNAINALTEIEQRIIQERYINGNQWWQVAYSVHCAERTCKYIRNTALDKLESIIFGEDKKD